MDRDLPVAKGSGARTIVMALYIMILLLLGPCLAKMEIDGTPLLNLSVEASNSSWYRWNKRLEKKPYAPNYFAWGMSYALRAFIRLYELTGDDIWLERAVSWADYYVEYSDVNGDGEPAWGNYNSTWGMDRYDFVEFTVHDGKICTPLLEVARLIRQDGELFSAPVLSGKADTYVSLVKQVVDRHHSFWTDVSDDSGYYWNDPGNAEMIIINRFAVLGTAEIMLADITGNSTYLEKPRKMARFIKDNMRYISECDCYQWPYGLGEYNKIEDISHGSLDLEFMIRAYDHGLHFNLTDMERLVNTYQRRIWQGVKMFDTGVGLGQKVDGSVDPGNDYTRLAKIWPLLCRFEPRVLKQHRAAIEIYARENGLPKDRVMAWILAQMCVLEDELEDSGVHLDSIRAFSGEDVLPELKELEAAIEETEEMGINMSSYRNLLYGLDANMSKLIAKNMTSLTNTIWNTTHQVKRAKAEFLIEKSQQLIMEAKELGIDTSRHEIYVERARKSLDSGFFNSVESLCQHPLSLEEELEFPLLVVFLLFTLTFGILKLPWR